jgi:hypothetical protein
MRPGDAKAPPGGQTETAQLGKLAMHHVRHRVRESNHSQLGTAPSNPKASIHG